MSEVIEARGVHKSYRSGGSSLHVLNGIDLTVPQGDVLAITGPSGAGKSTLLHLLAGLDRPTKGEVAWEGRAVGRMSDGECAAARNRLIGVVFQFYHLLPELSAVENVMLPGRVSARPLPRPKLAERARECLERVGLSRRAHHRPGQLSGGEQQRVAIARAIINRPAALLCDEPTGNLDSQTGEAVMDVLWELHRREQMSVVIVTHEQALAQRAKRWLGLRDGSVVERRE